jgi:hypothetical protein
MGELQSENSIKAAIMAELPRKQLPHEAAKRSGVIAIG